MSYGFSVRNAAGVETLSSDFGMAKVLAVVTISAAYNTVQTQTCPVSYTGEIVCVIQSNWVNGFGSSERRIYTEAVIGGVVRIRPVYASQGGTHRLTFVGS